jgi:hypothetical protein
MMKRKINNTYNFIRTFLSSFYSIKYLKEEKVRLTNDHFFSIELKIEKEIERPEVKKEYSNPLLKVGSFL